MRWLSLKSSAGLGGRIERRSGGILGEGGTMLEVAATGLHDDVLLDSEMSRASVPLR